MAKTKKESKEVKEISPKRSLNISRKQILLVISIIILVVLLFRFKSLFIAATVNGKPITRLEVIKELEKEGGKSVLDNLITNNLILQEAAKEKVTVSNSEISAQIDQIKNNLKSQGQDLNTALAAQGMTQTDLNNQIKLQILVQKMAGKDVTVTDKEAEDYFNQNKATYPKGAKFADVKDQIVSDLKQQKTRTAVTTWVSNLKSKAKINYFVSY
jgi:foldase protein PrsA